MPEYDSVLLVIDKNISQNSESNLNKILTESSYDYKVEFLSAIKMFNLRFYNKNKEEIINLLMINNFEICPEVIFTTQ